MIDKTIYVKDITPNRATVCSKGSADGELDNIEYANDEEQDRLKGKRIWIDHIRVTEYRGKGGLL